VKLEALLPSEVRSYEELVSMLDKLDSEWDSYRKDVLSFMDSWERVKVRLLEKISKTEGLVRAIESELEELKVEVALGLRSEDESRDELEKLMRRREELEDRLGALRSFLEEIETRIRDHRDRVTT